MRVDVILPTYVGERWVGEAIESVLQQTYPHWYLTVVDDASPDGTIAQVEAVRRLHPDLISLVRLQENRRVAAARMVAIRRTTGEVIAFLDQDDRWLPQKLTRQIERLQGVPGVDAVHTDVEIINPLGEVIPGAADQENSLRAEIAYDQLSNQELVARLFRRNTIRLASSMVRRSAFEAVGGFDESLFGGEDWEFWVRFADRFRVGHIPTPLVQRRRHERNTSRVRRYDRSSGTIEALEKMARAYPYLQPLILRRRARVLLGAVRNSLSKGQIWNACGHTWSLFKVFIGGALGGP